MAGMVTASVIPNPTANTNVIPHSDSSSGNKDDVSQTRRRSTFSKLGKLLGVSTQKTSSANSNSNFNSNSNSNIPSLSSNVQYTSQQQQQSITTTTSLNSNNSSSSLLSIQSSLNNQRTEETSVMTNQKNLTTFGDFSNGKQSSASVSSSSASPSTANKNFSVSNSRIPSGQSNSTISHSNNEPVTSKHSNSQSSLNSLNKPKSSPRLKPTKKDDVQRSLSLRKSSQPNIDPLQLQQSLQSQSQSQQSLLPQQSQQSQSNTPTVTRSNSISTSKSNAGLPRFVVLESGTHEHNLRNAKRQEKLGHMIKNLLGGKKLRNEAVSAVPNILSSISAIEQQKQQQLPPTLFSNLITQVKRGDITNYNNNNPHGIGINQPVNAKSVIDDLPDNIRNAANGEVDKRSFGERYGTCQDVVGSGAFGVVRIAHKKLPSGEEALFAVKEFRKKPSESEKKYSRRLTNEFCISSSLRHLNIIDTFDLLRDAKNEYCEVMEYCAGGDLYSLIITAGKLEYSEADCFFKQLLRGVHYMHEMGVAHRDLKPENLLLTSNGTLKITDFGNAECFKAAWEEEISYTGGICGSSPYIAPEEFTTEEFDARAVDIWACGVIYMAMRSGRQLWKVANTDDEFFNIYLSKRKDAKGYEPIEALKRARCRNVVYSILDPIPERRISSIQILNSEWVREIHVCCAGDSYHRENR